MSQKELEKFLDSLVADPLLFPIYNSVGQLMQTFCNIGARRCGPGEKFPEFDTKDCMADDMGRIMTENKTGKWKLMSGAEAALWAIQGRRAMGFMPSSILGGSHGHIVRIYPRDMALSGSLGHPVPWCADIGRGNPNTQLKNISMTSKTRPNWACKTSQAFPVAKGECLYFGYLG